MDRPWSDRAGRSNPALSSEEAQETEARLPWMRSGTPELMVTLRFANGDWQGFPYHDLASFQFIGNELLKLYFFHATVVIQGSSLAELADLIQRHQVMAIREQNEFTVSAGAPCVRKIGLMEPNLAALARKPAG